MNSLAVCPLMKPITFRYAKSTAANQQQSSSFLYAVNLDCIQDIQIHLCHINLLWFQPECQKLFIYILTLEMVVD